MNYYLDLTDRRICYISKNFMKAGVKTKELLQFSEIKEGDTIVFSPAKKFNDCKELELLPKHITIISGNINADVQRLFAEKHINHINLMEDEIFTYANANLTAEGALAILLEQSEKSFKQNRVLILGGGRIARSLSIIFNRLGIKHAIGTFNKEKYPQYIIYTPTVYLEEDIIDNANLYDVIVNTIPAKIINDEDLAKISDNTIFIDLASTKCLNQEKAIHFKYLFSPALPSRYTCETAGDYMYEAIMRAESKLEPNCDMDY